MEFEKSTPVTAEDVARADIPKLTVQPFHVDIDRQSPVVDHSHANDGSFSFETETTSAATAEPIKSSQSHHAVTVGTAFATTLIFGAVLAWIYFQTR